MKIDFTWGASAGVNRLNSYPDLVRMFQEMEDRFIEALQTCPVPQLDSVLEDGAVISVSFRKAVPE